MSDFQQYQSVTPETDSEPAFDHLEFLKRVVTWGAWIAVLIVAVGVIDAASDNGTGFLLVLISMPVIFSLLIVALVVLMRHGWALLMSDTELRAKAIRIVIPPMAMTVLMMGSWELLSIGRDIGSLGRLATNYERYDAIIKQYEANPRSASFAKQGDLTYSIDVGPPVRVAFNPSGFLSNWSSIVYDPSKRLGSPNANSDAHLRDVFGGELVFCRHLWGDYYRCAFT